MSSIPSNRLTLVDPGICRFCGNSKKCRILNMPYDYMGQKEVYSEMLMDCFGLLLSHLDGTTTDRLVCATCVVRLRACLAFKNQVVKCEEHFLKRLRQAKVRGESRSIKHETKIVHVDIDNEAGFPEDCASTSDYMKMEFKQPATDTGVDTESIILEMADNTEPYEDDGHDATEDSENPLEEYLIKEEKPFAVPLEPTGTRGISKSKTRSNTSKHDLIDYLKTRQKRDIRKEDEERTLKMKKMILLKMASLKAKRTQISSARSMQMPNRRIGARKDRMIIENTCKIVESSYVCPFHNITGNYYCFYCRNIFAVPEDLRQHTLTHDPNTFSRYLNKKKAIKIDLTRIDCRLCEESITGLDELRQHLTTKHSIKFHPIETEFLKFKLTHPTISCLECSKSFYFVDKLIDHMAEHFGSFICDKCGAAFVQASSLEAHIRCHNDPKKRFECNYCGKTLSTNRARYVHINTLHEKKPVIDCLKCEEKFFTYDGRNKHMAAVHGHNMSFPCNTCDKVFDSRKKFIKHNQMAHLKEYTHSCQLCEKKFFTATHMKRHIKTHNN